MVTRTFLLSLAAALVLLLTAAFDPLSFFHNGLDTPTSVGGFVNSSLPTNTPSATSEWETERLFPNLEFTDPVQLLEIPGTTKFLMAGKMGHIWSFDKTDNNTNVKDTLLDISAQVKTSGDEGLLGVVFHPEFGQAGSPNSQYLYVFYRYTPDRSVNNLAYCRLSRFYMNPGTLVMPADSEYVLINQYDRHAWHNGGGMFFGPDGFLYLTIGDEGGANDQFNTGQKIDDGLLAGILRLDVDKDPTRSHPIRRQPKHPNGSTPPTGWPDTYSQGYWVPDDNPWQAPDSSNLEEFYAIGLRSPHRMTYDAVTGHIWIGDIGQGSREEVGVAYKGANMQWPYKEGDINGAKAKPTTLIGTDAPPAYAYARSVGNCVIGGFVYRGTKWPDLYGQYLFGDHGNRKIWALEYDAGTNSSVVEQLSQVEAFGSGGKAGISSFATDSTGEVYILKLFGTNQNGGRIYRLKPKTVSPEPPSLLSSTGIFTNMTNLNPADFMIPYELQQPFWSDNAIKTRWMILPNDGTVDDPSEQITFTADGDWTYPTGTVMVKHFEMAMDETNPSVTKRLETRLLVHGNDGTYYGVSYRWRDDQSDADLLTTGLIDTLSINTSNGPREIAWLYPSRSECSSCHTSAAGGVLGPKTRQLNGLTHYPSTGRDAHQIVTLDHLNFFDSNVDTTVAALNALLTSAPLDDPGYTLEEKARTYLDANCSYCHRPGNSIQANFDALFSTPLANQELLYGTTYNSLGMTGMREIIPGDLEHSMIYKRIAAVHEDYAMPPLAKNLMDTAGVQLIADWINSIDPNQATNSQIEEADYNTDFQGTSPASGWSYLWNANGAIGTAANYTPMLWNGSAYDSDGNPGVPDNGTNLRWGNLTASGGHPGPSVGQGQAVNRYVIAAFTVSEAGTYEITNSNYTDANTNCGDGNELRVYVNNSLRQTVSFPNGGSTNFDLNLGNLIVGDVVYIAAGPGNNHDSCDGFTWDWTLERSETVNQQWIDFPPPAHRHVNDGSFPLTATASSSLPVSFSVESGPASVVGNTLTLNGTPGYVTIRATQTGNATYEAAPYIERTFTVSPVNSGDGTGLLGTYFDNDDLTNIQFTRTDPEVDFYWGNGSPDPSMEYGTYSVAWEGQIESPVSETITFLATSDDGVRLWVNNQLIIDNWQDQSKTTETGTIAMTAWARVPIRIEYYERGVYASARLEWASASLDRAIVPTQFLYPAAESSFPVEWLSFEAVPQQDWVQLRWTTDTELNSDYFQVERSQDGENFEAIGEVAAAGISQEALNYQLPDQDPFQGISYYRIKAIDLDGSFNYSELREVRLAQQWVKAYPNPLGQDRLLTIEAKLPIGTTVQLKLVDLKGQVLREERLQTQTSSEHLQWALPELPSGLYLLQIQAGAEKQLIKVRL
ncbi:MAG: PA14 domain-containing protein [Bacteroidota bacterium]